MLNPINHARTRIDMHRNRGSDLTQPDLQPRDRAVVLERDRVRWLRLFEQNFRVDKWNLRLGYAAARSGSVVK